LELQELLHERTSLDIIIILIYLIGVIIISNNYLKISRKHFNLFLFVGISHLLFTFLYYAITLNNVADAIGYYRRVYFIFRSWPETLGENFGQGSNFIYFLLYPLVNFFNISYFGCFFIFSYVGLLGFKLIYDVIIHLFNNKWSTNFLLLLLPNLHFWSVGIGKDALIFFALSCFLSAFYFKKSVRSYIIPFILVGFIRIHIVVFIAIGYMFATTFQNKSKSSGYKAFIIVFISLLSYFIFPLLKDRLGVDDTTSVDEKLEKLQNVNMNGDSGVDLSNSLLIVKWLAYMYRPLFYDTKNVLSLLASIENTLYVVISFKSIKLFRFIKKVDTIDFFFWFCFFIMMTVTLPSAYLLSNLGIAMRQKTMAFPFFLSLFFYLVNSKNKIYCHYDKIQFKTISDKKPMFNKYTKS
jgi:hypothetical protein